jgi:Tfp pilus assembly PilM family ATPase
MKLPTLLRTPPPRVAVEIGPARLTAVSVAGPAGAAVSLTGWAVEPLPAGTVVPSLTAPNVARPAELRAALGRLWERLGQRPKRVGLVIPDAAAKVSLVRFKDVPAKASDLEDLIKFQIRKAAPFRVEDSQISHSAGERTAEGQDFIVVQARREAVLEYEQACVETGASPGHVDLSTFGLAHCALATSGGLTGDWLLVHAGTEGASIAIFRGQHLVFFRNRGSAGDGHLGDLVHQTAMYYQDRLGGRGFIRVFVGGTTDAGLGDAVWKGIQERLGVRAEIVAPGPHLMVEARRPADPGTAGALAPAAGAAFSLWSGE